MPAENSAQPPPRADGGIKKDQDAPPPPHNGTLVELAETRTNETDSWTEPAAATNQALRMSELNYRRLFETAPDGILILDAETGRVKDVNPFLIKLLGFTHGYVRCHDLLHGLSQKSSQGTVV